ncbi:F-type H+-transporting ATPase subunit a [Paenibacillus phyllosphaerae]|uniref:ATP synthase subunit a n=1 Tax=Paenibacillus phyllosphaerae TaxID=274593 RepID=A0A7W5AXU5_9BACL|nr:F0F1 ATP synthase subunit A [Paenibacillus phyllosphaerae]MBB3110582.1 F-type H+-transporting ATPase subunit a [Paenibacillus phyllosphaerae]
MHLFPVITIGGLNIDLSSFIAITVSAIITFVLARLAVRNLSVDKPGRLQNFMEWVAEFVHNTIASAMPLNKVKPFMSLGMTLIMFIFISNLLGLPFGIVTETHHVNETFGITQEVLDEHEGHAEIAWWKSPTADISVTAGLALIVFFLINFLGLKMNTKGYLKSYFEPYWFFFPLKLIEEIAKPLTLALRLYANIFAGEVLIATILMLGVIGTPFMILWQGFSLFVGAIQAFLFTILTMVYISHAIVSHHDEEHEH